MIKRVMILVEGHTEERFVKEVLNPAFESRHVFFSTILLTTKRVKNGPDFKGGVTSFGKFKNDLQKLLFGSGDALVTTLLDYYGLPSDFPGMNTRQKSIPVQRVTHIEQAIAKSFGSPANFIPFLALHEFEAWLFSSAEELPAVLTEGGKKDTFSSICTSVTTPEDINERPEFAPSKRIVEIYPSYRKTVHGPAAVKRIGLDKIRSRCPHFDAWICKLESFAI